MEVSNLLKTVDKLENKNKIFAALSLGSLITLFELDWRIPQNHRVWVWFIFLFSSSFLLLCLIEIFWISKQRKDLFKNLTKDEKGMLKKYVIDGRNTLRIEEEDGVSAGLRGKNILYRAANVSSIGCPPLYSHNIQPWALKYLKKHKKLLD